MSFHGSAATILALVASSLFLVPGAHVAAQDAVLLTLEEARALALESGPRFLAAAAMGEAARGVARTARVYPFNPRAEIKGVEALDPGGWGDYEAVFSQEIEWAGQWFVRRDAGAHAMDAARESERDAVRILLLELDHAFFRLKAAEERFRVAQEGADLAESLRGAVRSQLQEGQASNLDLNLADIGAGRAGATALTARNELNRAQQGLRDLLGLEAEARVGTRGTTDDPTYLDSSDPSTLVEIALANRPDVQAARAREEEARSRRRLASLEALPNVDLGAVAKRSAAGSDPTYGIRIALPIPIWNRGQGRREEFRAIEELTRVERLGAELRVQGEVMTALEAYRTSTEELEAFTVSVLIPVQESRELLQAAYRAGRWDLPTTLLLQSQLVESELAYWDSWLRQRDARAIAEAAVGPIPETAGDEK